MEHKYDWARFLVPRDKGISLDSAGFLRDPSAGFGNLDNPDLVVLSKLADLPAVVLLGEPGMGKTMLLGDADVLAKAEGRNPVRIDLGDYGSEERLYRCLTDRDILAAGVSALPADLLIDGVDTSPLSIPVLASLLAEALRKYLKSVDLRVRLTCRSAVWPSTLEDALIAHWGEAQVRVFEMAPLRRQDVAQAAQAEGLDADAFLAQVESSHGGALAARPVTLRFLLGLAKDGRSFPATRVALYREGCERLCAEDSQARRETGRRGNRTPSERLTIAARIAAVLMLTNREAVWVGPHADLDRQRDCSVNDLVGRALMPGGTTLEVSQNDLFETLDTGLFWLRGTDRLHFAHQSYGEFLAAWYLENQRLPSPRKLDLLSSPGTIGLIPQLHEVTAWAAALDRVLFRSVLAIHPPVLLASDVATADPDLRAALVDGMLDLAQAAEWADTEWGLRAHYRKLAHPHLAEQLRPWIEGKGRFIVARRIAIVAAEACGLTDLQDALTTLALDPAEQPQIRQRAVDALGKVGDLTHKRQLQPLLGLSLEEDPEDAIKGAAMRALWPDAIDLDRLLAHVGPPRNPSHFGSYRRFISDDLAPALSPEQVPRALIWVRGQIRGDQFEDDVFNIAPKIVARAIACMGAPGVSEELARTALRLLALDRALLPEDLAGGEFNPLRDVQVRKRLLLAMLPLIQDSDRDVWLLTRRWRNGPAILESDDVPWLLGLARRAASPTTCWTLARLVQESYRPDQANAILEACADKDALRRALSRLCRTAWLGSRQARVAREHLARRRRLGAMRLRPPPVPPPAERIATTLARSEGGDADAFVQLTSDLTLGEDGRYLHTESADLRATPGWEGADPATRSRIVGAAARYLRDGNPEHDKLLEVGERLDSTQAAIHALYLLDAVRTEVGPPQPEPDWRRWAPVTLPRFIRVGSGEDDWAETALRRAYAAAPGALREAIRRHLDRDLETGDWVPTAQGLEPIWDTEIARILLTAAKAARGKAKIFRPLISTLLRQDRALDYALHVIGALPEGPTDAERDNAVVLAALLVKLRTAAAWPLVWRTMQRNPEFGHSLVAALADDWPRDDEDWWSQLGDSDLGDLSSWLETRFPREQRLLKDRGDGWTVGWRGSSWDLEWLRDKVLNLLMDRGTTAAVAAVGRIAAAFPAYPWFRLRLARARESLRRVSWVPPSPAELLELTSDSEKRLVRDAPELLKLVLESLGRFQDRLTGWNGLVRSFWNEGERPRPKDENFFSDVVRDHLQRDLKGIAAQREVEVRNLKGRGTGERTDILVTATATEVTRAINSVAVVIECKGCWHKDLITAMESQLKGQYLIDEGHRYGLYLVAWFLCKGWDDKSDKRRATVPDWTLEEAGIRLNAQADALSDGAYEIRAFVVDARLPTTKSP